MANYESMLKHGSVIALITVIFFASAESIIWSNTKKLTLSLVWGIIIWGIGYTLIGQTRKMRVKQ